MLLLDRGALETVKSTQFRIHTSCFYCAASNADTGILKILLDRGAIESKVPSGIFFTFETRICAMIIQRLSPVMNKVIPHSFAITSTSHLIYCVHAMWPHQTRRTVLEIVYHDIIACSNGRLHRTPRVVFEIVAFVLRKWHPTIDFYVTCGAGAAGVERIIPALENGIALSECIQRTQESSPRSHPWFIWQTVIQMIYGVPAEWSFQSFWESPAQPCVSPVLELQ